MSFWDDGRSAEYQRQQLNLMRKHQGLPPIPPPPYADDIVTWSFRIAVRFCICFYLVFGIIGVFVNAVLGLVCAVAAFAWLSHRRGIRLRQRRIDQLEAWERAGCP